MQSTASISAGVKPCLHALCRQGRHKRPWSAKTLLSPLCCADALLPSHLPYNAMACYPRDAEGASGAQQVWEQCHLLLSDIVFICHLVIIVEDQSWMHAGGQLQALCSRAVPCRAC